MSERVEVLDHGYVELLNLSGPVRRPTEIYDADDTDPAAVARISFDQREKERTREADIKLARYLIKNKHTTPIEMIETWWEEKMPIFVARQMIRHRTLSVNEMSGRYTQLEPHFYIPDLEKVGSKSASNKQGRDIGGMSEEDLEYARIFCEGLEGSNKVAYELYELSLKSDIPTELARLHLPVNTYTKWIWKQDLWNTMHFLRLRLDGHAQYEIRVYAEAKYEVLKTYLPELMKAFDEYIRQESPWKTMDTMPITKALMWFQREDGSIDGPREIPTSIEETKRFSHWAPCKAPEKL